jgi:16S rRNA (uracil1498-N3)-methyltransferase
VSRFFAPAASAKAGQIDLPADEAHHLRDVLRLGVGEIVRVFDGAGSEWRARVTRADRRGVAVDPIEPVQPVREPAIAVTVGVGLLKGRHMEAVIRDATMMGAAAVVPLATAHIALPDRARGNAAPISRWTRVAVASAKQCGRAVVPDVEPVAGFDELIARPGFDAVVMSVEPSQAARVGARETTGPAAVPRRSALVLIGPEGGWSDSEIETGLARGARIFTLGPRTIRAESAPLVLLSSLWTQWGW